MKKSTSKKKPVKKTTAKKKPVKRSVRTVAIITGLKAGDPAKLAPQPCKMANIAYELGSATRADFLLALKKVIDTNQTMGRLFSFHKPELVRGGFIKFKKVPRDQWLRDTADSTTDTPTPAQPEPAAVAPAPAADPAVAAPTPAPEPATVG